MRIDGTGHGRESVGKRQAEYLVVPGVPPQRDHNPAVTPGGTEHIPHTGSQKQVDQQLEKQHHAEQNADCRPLLCHAGQTEIKQTAHTVPTVGKDSRGVTARRQQLCQCQGDRQQSRHNDDRREQRRNLQLNVEQSRDCPGKGARCEGEQDGKDRRQVQPEQNHRADDTAQGEGAVHRQVGKIQDGVRNVHAECQHGKAESHLQTVQRGIQKQHGAEFPFSFLHR